MKYTREFYNNLQLAYDRFNEELFESQLPDCFMTLQRKTNTNGFYRKNAFTNRSCENIAEIALNPDSFSQRTIEEILSTLVHEQAHLLCDIKEYVCRKGRHSKQWCEIMSGVGLQPIDSNTGEDCNEGGAKLTQRIIEGDLFDTVCKQLLTEIEFDLTNIVEIKEKKEKKVTKHIYVCPECETEVTCKLDNKKFICADCSCEMKMETQ